MKQIDIIALKAMSIPIAEQTSLKNDIPTAPTGSNLASQSEGFPSITMEDAATAGGQAPSGRDFNGLFNLLSNQLFFAQNGGVNTFNPAVATAIGGYPEGAVLSYITDSGMRLVKSIKDDNFDNFVSDPELIDGESWDWADGTMLTDASNAADGVDVVVEYSAPGVNPWWRKYKSGWVEQGGLVNTSGSSSNISLPVPMVNSSYSAAVFAPTSSLGVFTPVVAAATTSITVRLYILTSGGTMDGGAVGGASLRWSVWGWVA